MRQIQEKKRLEEIKLREQRAAEELERKREEYERSLVSVENWKASGKTEIPSLFDKKTAYMS